MKQVLLICVNYNSYKELIQYLNSIEKALINNTFKRAVNLTVYVVDNSILKQEINFTSPDFNLKIIQCKENKGYLGAAALVFNSIDFDIKVKLDYMMITNVDILLEEDFFINLFNFKCDDSIGWIAPKIWSVGEKRDRNPRLLSRPKLSLIKKNLFLTKHPLLMLLWRKTISVINKRLTKRDNISSNKRFIYAGHGSCFIFTNSFIKYYPTIEYPSFLFGEEVFFGELCIKKNLNVLYYPLLKVIDFDHVSTQKISNKNYCEYLYKSSLMMKKLLS